MRHTFQKKIELTNNKLLKYKQNYFVMGNPGHVVTITYRYIDYYTRPFLCYFCCYGYGT